MKQEEIDKAAKANALIELEKFAATKERFKLSCKNSFIRGFEIAQEMQEQEKEDFAIGFAEWIVNSYYSYNFAINMFQHRHKEIYKTTKELLEIYKKEKGL
jgi:hypothetical protein